MSQVQVANRSVDVCDNRHHISGKVMFWFSSFTSGWPLSVMSPVLKRFMSIHRFRLVKLWDWICAAFVRTTCRRKEKHFCFRLGSLLMCVVVFSSFLCTYVIVILTGVLFFSLGNPRTLLILSRLVVLFFLLLLFFTVSSVTSPPRGGRHLFFYVCISQSVLWPQPHAHFMCMNGYATHIEITAAGQKLVSVV